MQWPPHLPKSQILLAGLWAAAVIRVFWENQSLSFASGLILSIYILAVIGKIPRRMKILISCLSVSAISLAILYDGWLALWQGLEHSVVFAAFFGTVILLRATADQRPEITEARQLVEKLGAQERNSGLMAGSQFLGSILNIGVMSIFAPIIGPNNSNKIRKTAAEACLRGMCLCCLWSPFWLAMALCYEHLPNVKLWQIMTLGLTFVFSGFSFAHLLYTRNVSFRGALRSIAALIPVLPPVAAAASVVLLLNAITPLSTLQCLITGIPLLCITALAFQGRYQLLSAIKQAGKGMGTIHSEIVLLTTAILLGRALIVAIEKSGFNETILAIQLPDWGIISAIISTITICAFFGVHQIVTATLMLVIFATVETNVLPLITMEAILLGWAFSSMTGLSAVSVTVASNMFSVPIEDLAFGPNLKFIAVFGLISIICLTILNRTMI